MYQWILFDLDGTITDPKEGITKSVQYALKKYGIDEPDLEKLVPFIGPPLAQSFSDRYGFNASQSKQAVAYYREYFVKAGMFENAVFDGVPEMLQTLSASGRHLAIATSKPTEFTKTILEHFRLDSYFEQVVGSNLDGSRVEKAEVIEFLLEGWPGVDKTCAIMIGDRMHDIAGAHRNGLPAIAVSFGYGTRSELVAAEPEYIADSIGVLTELLLCE